MTEDKTDDLPRVAAKVGLNVRLTPEGLAAFRYPEAGWEERAQPWLEQWARYVNSALAQAKAEGTAVCEVTMPRPAPAKTHRMSGRRACALYVLGYLSGKGVACNSGVLHGILSTPSEASDRAVEEIMRQQAAGVIGRSGPRTGKRSRTPGSPFVGLNLTVTCALLRDFEGEGLLKQVSQTHPVDVESKWWASAAPTSRYYVLSDAGLGAAVDAHAADVVPEEHYAVLRTAADDVIARVGNLIGVDALGKLPANPPEPEPALAAGVGALWEV